VITILPYKNCTDTTELCLCAEVVEMSSVSFEGRRAVSGHYCPKECLYKYDLGPFWLQTFTLERCLLQEKLLCAGFITVLLRHEGF